MSAEDIRSHPQTDSNTSKRENPKADEDLNSDHTPSGSVPEPPIDDEQTSDSSEETKDATNLEQVDPDDIEIFQLSEDESPSTAARFDDREARALSANCEKFGDLPIQPKLLEAIDQLGWSSPTPVQKLCLPFTLSGRDVAGFAQTGTGKTGVFLITACNQLLKDSKTLTDGDGRHPRVIVLVPTRELAIQVHDDAQNIFKQTGLNSVAIYGGVDYDKQAALLRKGVDVIVATPGRLMDYAKKGVVNLSEVKIFVCDEADRMFDMGFIEDVEFFLKRIPEQSQKLLFSATTNEQVKELAFEYLETPEYISVNPEILTPEKIEQKALHVHAKDKLKVMMGLLRDNAPDCAIIFTNTKLTAEWLWFKLSKNNFEVDLITGDLPQNKRIRLIERIKRGELKALIATDVASRGLHISRVSHVYNFDLPDDPSNYVHRIGRTARAGARGTAISLVCDDYGQNLTAINALLGPAHAVESCWFDEKYLTIEDKAGNPFKLEDRESSSWKRNRGERGDTRRRPSESMDRSAAANSRNYKQESRNKNRTGHGNSANELLDSNSRERKRHRKTRQQDHWRREGTDQDNRHNQNNRENRRDAKRSSRSDQNQHQRRGEYSSTQTKNLPSSQPKGLFAMLKAIFLSLFGRRSKDSNRS